MIPYWNEIGLFVGGYGVAIYLTYKALKFDLKDFWASVIIWGTAIFWWLLVLFLTFVD
tara:strand:+ start:545 stop:718 length:174 start_codon:yes stop_codon:yes gene_type:complete